MALRLNNSYFRVSNGVFRSVEPVVSSGGVVLSYTVTELLTTTGAGTWTKPVGITSVTVECWGGGGGGAGSDFVGFGGGGGGGGAYARKIIAYPSASQNIGYTVGAGGTTGITDATAGGDSFWNTNEVLAKGGGGGLSPVNNCQSGSGGSVSECIGDIKYRGGNGIPGFSGFLVLAYSAGGGGAGSTGDGGDANSNTDIIANTGGLGTSEFGGNGANGNDRTISVVGVAGSDYGGGGSGAHKEGGANRTGGVGAQGLIRVSYSTPPPLQTFTGSNAAFSIRKISNAASASMQVQRSSDNAVLDIGFQADGMLDTGSLLTFVGANTGYVKYWYDQTGGDYKFEPYNGSPTTWPIIVTAGTLETTNGKPAIKFNAGQTLIIAKADQSYTDGGGLWFQFAVAQVTDATTRLLTKIANATNIAQAIRRGTTGLESIGYNTVGGTGTDTNGVSPGTAQFLAYAQRTTTGVEIYMNGTSNGQTAVAGTPATEAASTIVLGSFNPATLSFPWSGTVQEVIHYPQSSDTFNYRVSLTEQINAYYGTF